MVTLSSIWWEQYTYIYIYILYIFLNITVYICIYIYIFLLTAMFYTHVYGGAPWSHHIKRKSGLILIYNTFFGQAIGRRQHQRQRFFSRHDVGKVSLGMTYPALDMPQMPHRHALPPAAVKKGYEVLRARFLVNIAWVLKENDISVSLEPTRTHRVALPCGGRE